MTVTEAVGTWICNLAAQANRLSPSVDKGWHKYSSWIIVVYRDGPVQAAKETGPVTADETVGTWFSNPAAQAAAAALDQDLPAERAGVGKYLPAAAMRAARAPAPAAAPAVGAADPGAYCHCVSCLLKIVKSLV